MVTSAYETSSDSVHKGGREIPERELAVTPERVERVLGLIVGRYVRHASGITVGWLRWRYGLGPWTAGAVHELERRGLVEHTGLGGYELTERAERAIARHPERFGAARN